MEYKKLSTLNKKYLLREIKEGFEDIKHGELELVTAKKTGFEEYANFSGKCEVVVAPEDGKYKVGQHVFVHHGIATDKFQNNWFDELLYATREENIWFKGEKPEDCVDDDLVIFKYLSTTEKKREDGIIEVGTYNDKKGVVVSGALPKGSIITYRLNKELEFFFNEDQYLITDKLFVTSVDGVPYGDWYEFNDFKDDYFDCGILSLKGQTGISKKLGIELDPKKKIVKLSNEFLPLNGKTFVVSETWQDSYVNGGEDFYFNHYSDIRRQRGILVEIETPSDSF